MFFVYLFFFANLLFCLAYVVRDMLWLRAITICAASCTLPYFYFQSEPLYSAMGWQLAFIVINAVNLTVLLLERRPLPLTKEQRWLHEHIFRSMNAREMVRVLNDGRRHSLEAGEVLVRRGEHIKRLILLIDGQAEARVDGHFKATLQPGDFVGEMSFVTGEPTSADVVARSHTEYIVWDSDVIQTLFGRHPDIKDSMHGILGMDMARKLARRSPVLASAAG
ncbi:MAG: Crp/Fnr family transcriptional regulator [Pseudomonadota bacterium]